jgi:SrtB family sortase
LPDNENKTTKDIDIDSIVKSLDLEALGKKYGAPGTATADPNAGDNPQQDNADMAADNVSAPDGKFKVKLLDFFGMLLLMFSLVIFGIPMIIGKSKRQFSAAACIALSAVILLSSYFVLGSYTDAKAMHEQEETTQTPPTQSVADILTILPDTLATLEPKNDSAVFPEGMLKKYETVYQLNQDVIGWLKIPNTSIDTLITQVDNNNYYLRNDFYGKYTEYGNAFIDYRNKVDPLSQNTIIYGHTTKRKLQVFNDLYKYMDYDFYLNNPIIEFGTIYKDYRWKIFSIYITTVQGKDDNGYFFYYIHPEINESKFTGYLNQIIQRSRYFTDVDVNDSDKILTLSTCVYDNNFAGNEIDTRLVIAARLMREGEGDEVDPAKIIDNKNFRRPQAWYSHFGLKNPYANSERWKQ